MTPLKFAADDRVLVSGDPIVAFSNGLPLDAAGNLVVAQGEAVLQTAQGLPRSASGAIVVTEFPGPTTWSQGLMRDAASGAIVVSENAASVWGNGVPLDSSGALAVSGLWDPSKLFESGESGAYFDVSDLTTLFQDSAGTIPASVGSPVGMMMDISGNGNHATQTTAINRPVLQRDSTGRLCLAFNGTNSAMAITQLNMSNTPSISASVGFAIVNDTNTAILVEFSENANSGFSGAFFIATHNTDGTFTPGINSLYKGTALGVYTRAYVNPTPPPPFHAVASSLMRISDVDPLIDLRVNKIDVQSVPTNSGTGNFGSYPFFIGARGAINTFFTGNLYGLIVRGALSSAAEIAATESWLNARTGAY